MSFFSRKKVAQPQRRLQTDSSERATDASLSERYSFRRNRTLTGSASSRVSTVGEAHAQLKSSRVKAHDLVRQRRRIGVILMGVVVAGLALYGLVSQFTAHASVSAADPALKLDASYAATIDQYLQAQPIERLRFMVNLPHLTDYLQAVAPEVAEVHLIGSAGFGKSEFQLTMRRPIVGWSIGGEQQYVDGHGVSFVRNYYKVPPVQIVDQSGVQTAAGVAVASNQFLGFVGRVVGLAAASQLTVTEVIIPQGTARQIELRLENISYPIKLSVDRPAGEQVEDMARSIAWLVGHGQTPEYLDVRTSGRAFYL